MTTAEKAAIQEELSRAASLRAPAQFVQKGPLGMPKGSVRGIITLVAIGGYTAAVAYSMLTGIAIPESLNTIVITVVAFYFGTRAAGKEVEGNEIEVSGNFSGEADRVMGAKNLAKHR